MRGKLMDQAYFDRESYKLETASSTADVAPNYSPAPAFGEYEDLIHFDRNAR